MRSTSAKIALSLFLSLALGAAGVAHSADTAAAGDTAKGDKGDGKKDNGDKDKGDKGGKGKKGGGRAHPLVVPT